MSTGTKHQKPPDFMLRQTAQRTAACALAGAMAVACFWALRLAYAGHRAQGTSTADLDAALRIAPGNAGYWLHWAELQQAAGQPGSEGLARAAQVDPYDAHVWTRAGFDAEIHGDLARAEQDLLTAARRSHQSGPRWALANFYFRRADAEHFWPWVKSALAWTPGDPGLLFDLCWRMQPDADVILRRAIPDKPAVWRAYLWYLLETHRSGAALAVAARMEAEASPEDRDVLIGFTERMLAEHQWSDALAAWNALCLRKLVQYAALDPQRGAVLTNGAFASKPLEAGFDWRLPEVKGVAAARNDAPPALHFDFSGDQPENCNLVYQLAPVTPGMRYALRFQYRTDGIEPGSGLGWRVTDAATGKEIPIHPLSLSSGTWAVGNQAFAVPPGVPILNVILTYRRQSGTVRIEGTLWLRQVGLEQLP